MEILLKYFPGLTPEQIQQFAMLDQLYREWNAKINVISRKDIDSLYEKHILHSLALAAVYDFERGTQVIDIGTGGGFPGIPLAIFFPEVEFFLADSINKKLKVVEAVTSATGLKNVTTKHIRAEEIRDRKFDFAVSRAVAPLKDLWAWCRPLLKPAGKETKLTSGENRTLIHPGLICMKGGDLNQEIRESGLQPELTEISSVFAEDYFREKYLLYVKKKAVGQAFSSY